MSRTKRRKNLHNEWPYTGGFLYYQSTREEHNEWVKKYQRDCRFWHVNNKLLKWHSNSLSRSHCKKQLSEVYKCCDYEDLDLYYPKKLIKRLIWNYD